MLDRIGFRKFGYNTLTKNSGGKINFQNGSTFNLTSDNTTETIEIIKQFDLIVRAGALVNYNGGLVAVLHNHPLVDMEVLGMMNIMELFYLNELIWE